MLDLCPPAMERPLILGDAVPSSATGRRLRDGGPLGEDLRTTLSKNPTGVLRKTELQ